RLKDILDLLADTGMGKGAMFLIGQNKIDEILNSRPEDRRSIFEEAAGIARFRMRKKEATRRLDDTANNLTRINDIKSEVESRVEPLRVEAERTTHFNELNGKLRICRLTQFVNRVETIEQARAKLQQEQEACNQVFLEKSTDVSKQEALLAGLQQELDTLNDQVSHIQAGITEKEKALEAIKGEDAVLDERIEQSIRQQGNLAKRNEKLQEQIDQWTAQLESLAREFDVLEAKRDEAAALVTDLERQQADRMQAQKENEAKIQELTDSNFEDMRKMIELRNEIRSMEAAQEQRMNRRNRLKDDVDAAEQRVNELTEEQRGLLSRKGELEQDVTRYIKEGNELAAKAADKRKVFQEVEKKYNECQTQIASVESRLRLLQDMQQSLEGFGYGVRAVMQSQETWRDEVIGPAAALISVEPAYVTAVETALGAGGQNLVIQSADAAKQAIRYLKDRREGRATFLPLDTIKEPVLKAEEKTLAKLPGIRGFAADLLQCDEHVKPALRFLIGRVLVAETMDHALAAARKSGFRLRVVTLDGDMVNAGGSLTGGSRQKKEAGYLSREKNVKEQETLLQKYNKDLLAIQEEKEVLEDALQEQEKQLAVLRDTVQQKNIRLTEIKAEEQRLADELKRENEALELAVDTRTQLANEYLSVRQLLADKRKPLQEMEAANTEAKNTLDSLQQKIGADRSALETLAQRLQDARVQAETANTQRQMKEERMKQLDGDLGRLQGDFNANAEEHDKLGQTVENSKQKKTELAERNRSLMQELQDIITGQHDYSEQRLELTQKQGAAGEKLKALRSELSKAETKVHQNEIDNAKLESDYQNALEQLTSEYKVNLAEAREEAKAEGVLEDKSETALRRMQASLQRQIEELGPVNPGAIEEYKAVSERYEFLQKQYTDLCEARDKLQSVISEINSGMTRRFKEAFGKINGFFQNTYVQLFGGGTAMLKLTDPENILESGIDIEAQPPGKKLQSLFLLSGGERALTVIALLFALLSYHPSPFCILDEIDAPLDDANIGRFAKFLEGYALQTQFIVITHRKGTMEAANVMYGVTMEESGVSKILSVKMSDKLVKESGATG
ncbi:MAG: chromosome segregation protein SMC, partial [Acidaminococcaceae bacterium]|nr:chromosome segregation protein SMC [Acidaminococcaceae bacterium]